jgi:Ca-activated chloride channel homolog
VNAKIKLLTLLVLLLWMRPVMAESAASAVRQGNILYTQNKFNDAIKKYDEALINDPLAAESKFNKANSYYRLDDLTSAVDLYKAVAAESRDMKLVEKAKYNLGDCSYQQGLKQKDSDLQKAVEDFKTSIGYWRQVLDINPQNEKAAKNIEVTRLVIKDIIDQINKQKQQQDPNHPQDNKQKQDQQQKEQDKKQQDGSKNTDPNQQQQQQQKSQQDPNKSQEPNQTPKQQPQKNGQQDHNQPQEQKKQSQEQQQQQQPNDKKDMTEPDATAQEILDREQKDKKEREMLQRGGYQPVEKDW